VSAIVTSARSVPAPIGAEVADLAADLQAGTDPQRALDRFADQLADFTADEAVAALKLHVNDRGQHLADLLTAVAESAGRQAAMRRGVAAKRAEPRFVTRIMTVVILIVLGIVFADRAYAAPYGTPVGELVLFAAMLLLTGLLAWIRRLTQPTGHGRFLGHNSSRPAKTAVAASPAMTQQEAHLR
jgi:Flp pilus assembly protein TadB